MTEAALHKYLGEGDSSTGDPHFFKYPKSAPFYIGRSALFYKVNRDPFT